jgi:hypothetical protein
VSGLDEATKIVLLFAAGMFLWALLLGTLKYGQILRSPEHHAHPYTDIAHRAALLYSFALLLMAVFVQFGQWSFGVDIAASSVMTAYFVSAVAGYTWHGWRKDTVNQFAPPTKLAQGVHGQLDDRGGRSVARPRRRIRGPAAGALMSGSTCRSIPLLSPGGGTDGRSSD